MAPTFDYLTSLSVGDWIMVTIEAIGLVAGGYGVLNLYFGHSNLFRRLAPLWCLLAIATGWMGSRALPIPPASWSVWAPFAATWLLSTQMMAALAFQFVLAWTLAAVRPWIGGESAVARKDSS